MVILEIKEHIPLGRYFSETIRTTSEEEEQLP